MIYFEHQLTVQYYETDQMAVVHHSNYIRYFETARTAFMKEIGYPIDLCESEDNVMMPIVSVECHYHHPAKMGDVLKVTVEIESLPMAKMTCRQRVFNQNGDLCVDGTAVCGFINAKTFRPVRCPERFLEALEAVNKF